MKRTQIMPDPGLLPETVQQLIADATIYDSSCSTEATVWFIDKDGGFYLKSAPAGSLKAEAEMTRFFHSKDLSVEVLTYESADRDYFVTRAAIGEDCIHPQYLDDPKQLSEKLGILLLQLHETDTTGCPVSDLTAAFLAVAEENRNLGKWHSSRLAEGMRHYSAEEAWHVVQEFSGVLKTDTLIHGDYCLPNIMLDNWNFSAFIDVGSGGIGDRHLDLYWGCWSLNFNLKDSRWCSRFLDAYGRDHFDPEILKAISAFEAFG